MPDYATVANAAALSGLATTDFATYQITSITWYIEMMLNRNFGTANSHTHYFDIDGSERGLQLPHWPVIAVSLLRDNQREDSYTDMVEDTNYTLDKQAGLIRLILDEYNVLKGSSGFTKGTKTVKIIYTWGYASIPNDITLFADWLLAWIGEIKNVTGAAKTADGGVLRRVQIGDYQEAYDVGNSIINNKYKDLLSEMTKLLVGKYKFWGDESGDYYTSL